MGKNDNKDLAVGHMACAAAYIIFGINVVVCRDIATDGGLAPIVLFAMRSLVAGGLFWLVSLFGSYGLRTGSVGTPKKKYFAGRENICIFAVENENKTL